MSYHVYTCLCRCYCNLYNRKLHSPRTHSAVDWCKTVKEPRNDETTRYITRAAPQGFDVVPFSWRDEAGQIAHRRISIYFFDVLGGFNPLIFHAINMHIAFPVVRWTWPWIRERRGTSTQLIMGYSDIIVTKLITNMISLVRVV